MVEFKESKFYRALQDFFINNYDKEAFLEMLAEFYNRTEGIIIKNDTQDDLIKELREMFIEFNEKGIDENIVREKVNYFIENSSKIADIVANVIINTNSIKNVKSDLETKVNKNEIYLNDYNSSDIDNIKAAIELSKANGKNIMFDTKTYNVNEDIILDAVNCDFRNGTINLNGNSLIIENDGSLINCNIVNGGIVLRNGKNRIENIKISNFTTALKLDVGNYESFINNIRLENEENNANTIGIIVNCSDTTVSNVYGYGATTGIKIESGGDNYFKDIHLWLKKSNYYDGSKFIHVINGTGNNFINCCSDTYNNVFCFDKDFLYVNVTDMYIIHNTILYPNKTINLVNKNYDFLNGNCTINSNNFTTSNITLNIKDSALRLTYLNGNGSNTVFNKDSIKQYFTTANIDSKSIVKDDGKNLICNITLFFSSQYDLTTPIRIELPIFKHSYRFFGYCLGVGSENSIAMAQCTLENGVLTISKLNGQAPQLWSLNINFITTKDLCIN